MKNGMYSKESLNVCMKHAEMLSTNKMIFKLQKM